MGLAALAMFAAVVGVRWLTQPDWRPARIDQVHVLELDGQNSILTFVTFHPCQGNVRYRTEWVDPNITLWVESAEGSGNDCGNEVRIVLPVSWRVDLLAPLVNGHTGDRIDVIKSSPPLPIPVASFGPTSWQMTG